MRINIPAGLIGNVVEHHDKALFILLAPFIGPLFFAPSDPITALIETYIVFFLGMLARPLGALVFGIIADGYGRKQALTFSIVGMAITTGSIGFLPTYATAGIIAPILLATTRVLQNFFSAGETNGAAIFVLEHSTPKQKPLIASLLETSTIVGILIASAETMLLSWLGVLMTHWRLLMWAGGLLGILGLWLRRVATESADFQRAQESTVKPHLISAVQRDWRPLIAIMLAAGFSSTTYLMAVPFINGFLLLVAPLTMTELTGSSTLLLLLDGALLPVFGYLATKVSKEKMMLGAAWTMALLGIPLFYQLEGASFSVAMTVRAIIVVAGVCFAAPFRLWAKELIPPDRRCTIVNLGCSFGHLCIEGPAAVLSLWLFQTTGWTVAPGLYLVLTAALAVYALRAPTTERVRVHN